MNKKTLQEGLDEIGVLPLKEHMNGKTVEYKLLYKEIDPRPINSKEKKLAMKIAETSEEEPEVRYEVWDMSRPHEKPYTRESYMFAAWIPEDKVDEAKENIISAEEEYQERLTKLRERTGDLKLTKISEGVYTLENYDPKAPLAKINYEK